MEEILLPRVEVDSGRKAKIVRFSVERALKPIVDYRQGLFDRCFVLAPAIAQTMLIQGYKFQSRFGKWCPVKVRRLEFFNIAAVKLNQTSDSKYFNHVLYNI